MKTQGADNFMNIFCQESRFNGFKFDFDHTTCTSAE